MDERMFIERIRSILGRPGVGAPQGMREALAEYDKANPPPPPPRVWSSAYGPKGFAISLNANVVAEHVSPEDKELTSEFRHLANVMLRRAKTLDEKKPYDEAGDFFEWLWAGQPLPRGSGVSGEELCWAAVGIYTPFTMGGPTTRYYRYPVVGQCFRISGLLFFYWLPPWSNTYRIHERESGLYMCRTSTTSDMVTKVRALLRETPTFGEQAKAFLKALALPVLPLAEAYRKIRASEKTEEAKEQEAHIEKVIAAGMKQKGLRRGLPKKKKGVNDHIQGEDCQCGKTHSGTCRFYVERS